MNQAGRLANDQARNMVCLENVFCAGTMSVTFNLLGVPAQVAVFEPNQLLRPIFRRIGPSRALWETRPAGIFKSKPEQLLSKK